MLDLHDETDSSAHIKMDALRASIADMQSGQASPAEEVLAEMRQILWAKQAGAADGADPNSLLPSREKVPRSGG